MLPRYSRPRMAGLWTEEAKLARWLQIELAACEAWAARGRIPAEALATIRAQAGYDPARVAVIEAEVKHDVIAFLTAVAERVGPDARYIHQGLTSSDVLDTCLALQLRDAADLLLEDLDTLLPVLADLARRHRRTVMMGRTHGVHAEPTTFGLKVAGWYAEMGRNRARLARAREVIAFGKLSGAVGTFAHVPPAVEAQVCATLGIRAEPISTQVVPRDRHADYLSALAIVGASIERIAIEIRHLQRTEVREVLEPFAAGQKGSSAMPHKRNPELAERLTGMARILRAHCQAALENVALWHERDISHSSVERIILPDSTILLDYMLARLTEIVRGLEVHPERMRRNLEASHGVIFSQPVLLALTRAGQSREAAYRIVQRLAMQAWEAEKPLQDLCLADPEVRAVLVPDEIAACFDLDYHLREVDAIFERLGL